MLYLLIIIVAAGIATLMALPLTSRPLVGAGLVLFCYVLEALLVVAPAIPVAVQIYPQDIAFFLLFMATVLRYAEGTVKAVGLRRALLFLFVLFFVALGRGVAEHGLKQAANECRGWFYFLSGLAYFSSFDVTSRLRERLIKIWLAASTILVCLAIFRWIATVVGLSIVAQWEGVGASDIRVLNAGHANFLAIAFFASIFLNISHQGPPWQRKAFYVLGPVLVLLQHRTVWVQMVIGVLWLGLQDTRFRKKVIGAIATMAILGTVLAVFLFQDQSGIAAESLQNSATNEDTFMWRVAGWYQLLFNNPARNTFNDIIGQPFGTGFERVVMKLKINYQPHNYYVEAFLRVGIIGLGMLVWLYVRSIRRWKSIPLHLRSFAYPDARFWAMVLVLQMLFFLTYAPTYDQAIFAGIAMAGLRLRLRQPEAPPCVAPQPSCAPA